MADPAITGSGLVVGNAPGKVRGVEVTFIPTPAVIAAKFDLLGLDIRSMREPLKRSIQQVIAPSIGKNFRSGGRPEKWKPLAQDTELTRKREARPEGPPLIKSGALMRIAQQLNIWTITPDSAYVDNLTPAGWYGALQQRGFTGGYGIKTPARPFLLIQPEDVDEIDIVFDLWLHERALAAGFSATDIKALM